MSCPIRDWVSGFIHNWTSQREDSPSPSPALGSGLTRGQGVHYSQENVNVVVCFGSSLGSSGTAVSERPSVTRPIFFSLVFPRFHCHRLSPLTCPSTAGARYLRTNNAPSNSHSLLLFLFLPFFFVLRQQQSTLSRSRAAPVRLNTVLASFSYIFIDIFLHFPCTSGTTTTRRPTP